VFNYSAWPQKALAVVPLVGKAGSLSVHSLRVRGLDDQDHILFAAIDDDGTEVDQAAVRRLFETPCTVRQGFSDGAQTRLNGVIDRREAGLIEALKQQRSKWFAEESQKLEKWAEDRVYAAEKELQDTKTRIRDLKRETRTEGSAEEQHRIQLQIQDLEKSKRRLRQRIFEVEDEIIDERDRMIGGLEARLQQDISKKELFAIRWRVV
jgi:hypothetical protein